MIKSQSGSYARLGYFSIFFTEYAGISDAQPLETCEIKFKG